jgi:hypothetical protein
MLWDYFGSRGEMETIEVIRSRLNQNQHIHTDSFPQFLYEIIIVKNDNHIVAVRDHTAIVNQNSIIVHLSHNYLGDDMRRTGLSGWMRAWPILCARSLQKLLGVSDATHPITLVSEMEYAEQDEDSLVRLRSYEKAGFLKVDPQVVNYLQPDFRPPYEIDARGGATPLPLQLLLRKVGYESKKEVTGKEVLEAVNSLYSMYAREFRSQDMDPLYKSLSTYPEENAIIKLIPPGL